MQRTLAVGVLAVALTALPAIASAGWTGSAGGSAVAGTDGMTNASGFTAACTNKNPTSTIQLRWTPSPDPYITGYDIVRTSSDGTVLLIFVSGGSTSSHVDRSLLTTGGYSFTYTIQAVAAGTTWRTPALAGTGRPSFTGSKNGCVTL